MPKTEDGLPEHGGALAADWSPQMDAWAFFSAVCVGRIDKDTAREDIGISERQAEVLMMLAEGDAWSEGQIRRIIAKRLKTLEAFDEMVDLTEGYT